jgi:glutamate carboxypeptidase
MGERDVAEARAAIDGRMDAILRLWRHLVETESGSRSKAGVDRVAGIVGGALADLGFQCETVSQAHVGNHLLASQSFGGRGRILFSCHLDTVWPEGTVATWPFRVEGNRATGPGVGDMKGGIVVMLEALRCVLARGVRPPERITVVCAGDEELGSQTARSLIEREARRADWCFVMESAPPGCLVTGRSAVGNFTLSVEGRTAHCGGAFEDGASAIRELAHKVLALEALCRPRDGVIVSAGMVQGGVARQVVPDRASALFDVRARTREQQDRLLADLSSITRRAAVPGTRCSLSGEFHRPPFEESAGGRALFALARDVGRALGMDLRPLHRGGGSDGNLTAAAGTPTLDGLGPVADEVCSRREWADVESIPRKAALIVGLLDRLPDAPDAGIAERASGEDG